MERGIDRTEHLIHCIQNKIPVSFSKYGDGEFYCVTKDNGSHSYTHNCDNDIYSNAKQNGLIESFKYMVNTFENSYITEWWEKFVPDFWETVVDDPLKIKWAKLNTFIIGDEDNLQNPDTLRKIQLYKTIKESSMKKILVCNRFLTKAQQLFNLNTVITVSHNNWFEESFSDILTQLKQEISYTEQPMILLCCGMAAKILIAELSKLYPHGIFLDIGSAVDYLCLKYDTRGRKYLYNDLVSMFSDLLPSDWDDLKYDEIYTQAVHYLRSIPKQESFRPLFSFLIPTRKRPLACIQALYSIYCNASFKHCFEFLFAFDDDDTECYTEIVNFCESNHIRCKYIVCERYGYTNLHKYINKLCNIAEGKYVWLWHDDAGMLTQHWDIHFCDFITNNIKKISDWTVFDFSYNNYNFLFPCIQKKWYTTLGHYSLDTHCNTWIKCIAENLNLIMKIDTITIFHLKNRVPQEYLLDIIYENKETSCSTDLIQKKECDKLIIQYQLKIK